MASCTPRNPYPRFFPLSVDRCRLPIVWKLAQSCECIWLQLAVCFTFQICYLTHWCRNESNSVGNSGVLIDWNLQNICASQWMLWPKGRKWRQGKGMRFNSRAADSALFGCQFRSVPAAARWNLVSGDWRDRMCLFQECSSGISSNSVMITIESDILSRWFEGNFHKCALATRNFAVCKINLSSCLRNDGNYSPQVNMKNCSKQSTEPSRNSKWSQIPPPLKYSKPEMVYVYVQALTWHCQHIYASFFSLFLSHPTAISAIFMHMVKRSGHYLTKFSAAFVHFLKR